MSTQGKNSLSYKKKNVAEQDSPAVGVKNIAFAHEFSNAGEDAILFNSLNTPSAWTESKLSNPPGSDLLAAQLQAFAKNIEVSSSARGYIQKSEYIVQNSGIYFKNITSFANEIFEVSVSDVLVSGNRIVDLKQVNAEGELLNGTTDFNIGTAVNAINEEVMVFRNGIQVFRSDDNDSSGTTGNYYYLNVDSGNNSSVIRFFEEATYDEPIKVVSAGAIVDDPNVSTFQEINKVQGQIDAMVPTLAALANVPETDFQAAPNNVDLKQFGSRVIALEAIYNVDVPVLTEWSAWETIALNAVTTVPTKGTVVTDRVRWRQVGEDYEVEYQFEQSAGGTTGNGEYVLQLPTKDGTPGNYIEFADDQLFVNNPLNDVEDDEDQKTLVGYGHLGNGANRQIATCYASSPNNFRVGLADTVAGFERAWSHTTSTFADSFGFNFKLKFKGKNLTATKKIRDLI